MSPRRDALIDNVRVQGGQVERGNGCRQLEDDDGEQQPPLRPQVFDEQFPEHPVSTSRVTDCFTQNDVTVSLRPAAGS